MSLTDFHDVRYGTARVARSRVGCRQTRLYGSHAERT